ncbi:MAG: AsmA family protein [Acidobacteria bacterium]|nr:AsmA family protein [Acidobacteriota bacterium]MBW4044458.1 AsmA family protein [Acidobacteriota bacterium]
MKPWLKVAVAVAVLLIVVAIATPFFINANTFRPMLEGQLSQSLGRQVKLGNLSLSLFSGSLVADNIVIAEDPAFSTTPFLQAKSLHIGVEMMPLLLHRTLRVTRISADQPHVNLIHNASGAWNYSSLGRGAAAQKQPSQQSGILPGLTVGKLSISNGSAYVTDLPPAGKPLFYSKVNLTVHNFSFTRQFPFTLSAALPGEGTLTLAGKAGPINQTDTSDTPFDANLTLKHFDPVQAGVADPAQGFSMLADIAAHAASDGATLSTSGTAHIQNLKLVRNGVPAPHPVDLNFRASQDLNTRAGQVQALTIKTGNVVAQATGGFQLTPQQTTLKMRFTGQSLSIDQIQALLPAVGVKLPSGSALQGGTLTTTLDITGPANSPNISGPLDIENTRLAGFNLGSKLSGLAALGGIQTGNMTDVRSFRADLNANADGVRAQNIAALVPALGSATGQGTVSAAGALNFQLIVKLNTTSGVGGTAMGVLSALHGVLGQTAQSAVNRGIPMTVTGTTSDPHFDINAAALLGGRNPSQNRNQQRLNPAQVLGNLFGKPQ